MEISPLDVINLIGQAIYKIQQEWEFDEETDDAINHIRGLLTLLYRGTEDELEHDDDCTLQ